MQSSNSQHLQLLHHMYISQIQHKIQI